MAAQLIDERPEEDNVDITNLDDVDQQEPEQDNPDDALPDKYRGKSVEEIVRMHQEAEKLLGKQSSEVGELRKVVDTFIQQQTQLSQQQAPEPEDELDFFADPQGSTQKMIDSHPKIKEAEAIAQQYKKTTALTQLQAKHPDMGQIIADDKFLEWIKASKIRTQLLTQADQQYDYEAADELFSYWKERQGIVKQTVELEKKSRKQQVKTASTGTTTGNAPTSRKKIYRRSDIIKMMRDDPDRYATLADEIMQAYREKRVR